MKKTLFLATIALAAASLFTACKDEVEMIYPPKHELPDLPVVDGIHDNVKAPLYWSVYEYCYDKEDKGVLLLLLSENHKTDEELYQAMKSCS